MSALETALRDAAGSGRLHKLNLFRNTTRGGWEAAVSKNGSGSTFSVGIAEDPIEAILKAIAASGLAGSASKPQVRAEEATSEPSFSGGVFG